MWSKMCNKTQTAVYGIKNYRLLHSAMLELLQIACNQRRITSLVPVLILYTLSWRADCVKNDKKKFKPSLLFHVTQQEEQYKV